MSSPWSTELWRLAAVAGTGFAIGAPFGRGLFLATFAILAYFAWHLRQLFKLERWLRVGRSFNPPEGAGIWGEVFHEIYRLQQRNRRRKRRLTGILNQYQKATAAMPDATVVLGPGGDIQWFNEAANGLLDFKPTHDIGQRVDNLIRHPAFASFLAKGAVDSLEIPSPRDPRLTLSIRVVPYGEQRLLIARDISERQRLEQMRRDFVGNVSHELRTPLTVVAGFLETLAEGKGEADPRREQYIELMRQQTTRMQHLVEDLLLLSRLENDRNQPVRERMDVPAMLAMLLEDARLLAAGKRHSIEMECDASLTLLGAEREIYSAFNNLISNAVRYTPPGGRIAIGWYRDERGAHFRVTDNGVGIAPEHIPRVTERFYRVDPGRSRESGGTGLGLAIVKHVLQRHDARLRIESTPGKGSLFTCDFPAERMVEREEPRARSIQGN